MDLNSIIPNQKTALLLAKKQLPEFVCDAVNLEGIHFTLKEEALTSGKFFFDVNKRTGRFMMNGLLLSKGYPAINLPAKRQLEFNQLMLAFYASNDVTPMTQFMKSCADEKVIQIMRS